MHPSEGVICHGRTESIRRVLHRASSSRWLSMSSAARVADPRVGMCARDGPREKVRHVHGTTPNAGLPLVSMQQVLSSAHPPNPVIPCSLPCCSFVGEVVGSTPIPMDARSHTRACAQTIFLCRMERARSPLTTLFSLVLGRAALRGRQACIVPRQGPGPCAAHDRSCVASLVRNVLTSI